MKLGRTVYLEKKSEELYLIRYIKEERERDTHKKEPFYNLKEVKILCFDCIMFHNEYTNRRKRKQNLDKKKIHKAK